MYNKQYKNKIQNSTDKGAYLFFLRLLCKKDYSKIKLVEKGKSKGFDSEHITHAINELIDQKYLREDLYVESRIKGLMRKNYSASYIKSKLFEEKLDITLDHIYSIFAENNFNEDKQIEALIRKKMPRTLPEQDNFDQTTKIKAKIFNFLKSKGHNYSASKIDIFENYE